MRLLTILFAIMLMAACGNNHTRQTTSAERPPRVIVMDCDDNGSNEELQLKECVDGDFNGDGEDEYAAIYSFKRLSADGIEREEWDYYKYDHYDYVIFGDSSIVSIDIEYSGSYLINEGDLDGDGADEIGLFNHGGYSTWGMYCVYTYKNGVWSELISISHSEDWNTAPYQDLVKRCDHSDDSLTVMEVQVAEGGIVYRNVPIGINE